MEERKARSDTKCSFANSRTVAMSGLWFEEGEETEVSTPGQARVTFPFQVKG